MKPNENQTELPYIFEADLISSMIAKKCPIIQCYPFPGTAVVLGKGSRSNQEIKTDNILTNNISLYRRKGGGCSVVLDPGNLIISFAFPIEGTFGVKQFFQKCNDWLIQGLMTSNITGIYQDGISDLVVNNKKIAGTSFYRAKGVGLYSAAILVSPDISLMERYLKHPPREPNYRRGRTHSDFVLPLNRLNKNITTESLKEKLLMSLDPNIFQPIVPSKIKTS